MNGTEKSEEEEDDDEEEEEERIEKNTVKIGFDDLECQKQKWKKELNEGYTPTHSSHRRVNDLDRI